MPLNPASTESESQKLTLFGFNDMAFGCADNLFLNGVARSD